MKKTNFNKRSFSVAMSQETGCIVMLTIGADDSLKVVGSLDRDQSLALAHEIAKWTASVDEGVKKAIKPNLRAVN